MFAMEQSKVKVESKHRGLSPFRRHGKSRGKSPKLKSKSPTRGQSPFRLRGLSPFRRRESSSSIDSSDGGSRHRRKTHNILVCHENARSIVFRDHLRHVTKIVEEDIDDSSSSGSDDDDDDDDPDLSTIRNTIKESFRQSIRDSMRAGEKPPIQEEINLLAKSLVPELAKDVTSMHVVSDRDVEIEKLHVHMTPLPPLELGPTNKFSELLDADVEKQEDWTNAEKGIFSMLINQRACVKTLKNSEWGTFLKRFLTPHPRGSHRFPTRHDDIGPHGEIPYNSFCTSTTLLPESGKKMRVYGSTVSYNAGVVFALPTFPSEKEEAEEARRTETWCWPAGYSAKTEFNIDERGRLINGRQEALVSFDQLRQFNYEYVHEKDHTIAGKVIKGGFNVVPFNEVFLRVGGCDRFGHSGKHHTSDTQNDEEEHGEIRSLEHGVGLPVALFARDNTVEDIVSLFRIRSRFAYHLGQEQAKGLPLLLISNDHGVRVFTEELQQRFLKMLATNVNPFQNKILEPLTQMDNTTQSCLQQKFEELFDLDETMRKTLTLEECAAIAGGFGATDTSIIQFLTEGATEHNTKKSTTKPGQIQSIVTAGLAATVRCGDYYNARQLLILYSHVASRLSTEGSDGSSSSRRSLDESVFSLSDLRLLEDESTSDSPICPPALDTERLRSATNMDGLLSVLGAAQILRALKDGSARKRTEDSYKAVEEWVRYGEQSVSFRVASWRELRAAEGETHIAVSNNAQFMAFVSNKAITNRKKFAHQLRQANAGKSSECLCFLRTIYHIVKSMHSPCLRLELLQYILGLDNRYSVADVRISIELAATCLTV